MLFIPYISTFVCYQYMQLVRTFQEAVWDKQEKNRNFRDNCCNSESRIVFSPANPRGFKQVRSFLCHSEQSSTASASKNLLRIQSKPCFIRRHTTPVSSRAQSRDLSRPQPDNSEFCILNSAFGRSPLSLCHTPNSYLFAAFFRLCRLISQRISRTIRMMIRIRIPRQMKK